MPPAALSRSAGQLHEVVAATAVDLVDVEESLQLDGFDPPDGGRHPAERGPAPPQPLRGLVQGEPGLFAKTAQLDRDAAFADGRGGIGHVPSVTLLLTASNRFRI